MYSYQLRRWFPWTRPQSQNSKGKQSRMNNLWEAGGWTLGRRDRRSTCSTLRKRKQARPQRDAGSSAAVAIATGSH